MSKNPLNLAFRFALEVTAIALTFYWGWTNFTFPTTILSAIILPLLLMILWGGFRYPRDHGKGFKKVSGRTRLFIEAVVLTIPIVLNFSRGNFFLPFIFLLAIVFHYTISRDRVEKLYHEK